MSQDPPREATLSLELIADTLQERNNIERAKLAEMRATRQQEQFAYMAATGKMQPKNLEYLGERAAHSQDAADHLTAAALEEVSP